MNKRIAGFDGLRAIAVLMVFVQHRLLDDIGEIGHLGVWIFFALSGFLIIGILSTQRTRIEAGDSGFGAELKRFRCAKTARLPIRSDPGPAVRSPESSHSSTESITTVVRALLAFL